MHEESIDHHLRQALSHLEIALNQSIHAVLENQDAKKEVAPKWESFLGQFMHLLREKGKKSRTNPLSWISFAKLR
ncbi:hypothetical protein E5161_01765 [Cohnella pontilimi]|uniref:Uncharacterized protein n=1 Tax=Cohnella pontilimi TaxID=2564100 RepID=A0A4U0FGW2_9BACL|nr:hypothetical protein E5161_01765 [Cohnella pontilimi]